MPNHSADILEEREFDSTLIKFFNDLPEHVRTFGNITPLKEQLSNIESRRTSAIEVFKNARDGIANAKSGVLSLQQELNAFSDFMDVCRDDDIDSMSQTTDYCTRTWAEQQKLRSPTFWQALEKNVPAGVLVLFVLATLGGLYRYNLKLAVFHDSRACLLYTSPSPRDRQKSRMPSSA